MRDCDARNLDILEEEGDSFPVQKALYTGLIACAAICVITSIFFIKRAKDKREINGNLVKVSYKFSKDFE